MEKLRVCASPSSWIATWTALALHIRNLVDGDCCGCVRGRQLAEANVKMAVGGATSSDVLSRRSMDVRGRQCRCAMATLGPKICAKSLTSPPMRVLFRPIPGQWDDQKSSPSSSLPRLPLSEFSCLLTTTGIDKYCTGSAAVANFQGFPLR
jgi:hypothetical protein